MDLKDIAKALNTEFRPNDPEYFRLGVWHDGDTLGTSSIKVSKDLDSSDAFIDILSKKGTGQGSISDITPLKKKFNDLRKYLPPGDYGLRADHPTKAKMYVRDFLKQPGFKLSGEQGGAKVFDKKLGKEVFKKFDTLTMNVPEKTNPWTVRNDVYTLIDDNNDNRRLLEDHLTTKIKEGYKPKGILYGKDKTPHRLSTKSIERVLDPNDSLDKINIKKSSKGRPSQRTYWGKTQGSMEDQIKYTARVRKDLVNKFIEGSKIKPITKMHGHHVRMLQMYSPFFENLNDADIAELAKFAAKRFPLGDVKANIALLDEDFHNQLHNFMREKGYQLRSGVAKGTPDLGDTLESRKAALTHFFDNVQEPIEQELSRVRWDQQAKYNPPSNEEVLSQLNWMNDSEYAAEVKAARLTPEVGEPGRRLGGLDGPDLQVPKGTTPNVIKDRKLFGYMNDMAATTLRNPYVKVVGSAATGIAKFAGSAAAAFDPINAVTGTYGAVTADNLATGLEQGLKGLEGGASTAAWFAPAAAKVALPLAGATAITEAQRVPEVFKDIEEQPFTNITGDTSRPLGYTNPFESLFKRQDRSLTIDKQDRGL